MSLNVPSNFVRLPDFLVAVKNGFYRQGAGEGGVSTFSEIDTLDLNFLGVVNPDESDVGKAIRSALVAVGGEEKSEDFRISDYVTCLKIEEALAFCWGAANDARGAALDWLSTTTLIESLNASKDSLNCEIS